MGKAAKGEYGLGTLYEKHGAWHGRWRTPGGLKRNRKIAAVKETGDSGLSRTEARRELQRMIERDGSAPLQDEQVPTLVSMVQALADRLETRGRSTSHVEDVKRGHVVRSGKRGALVPGDARR